MGYLYNKVSSTFLYPVNKTVDGIMAASRGVMCLASSIFGAGSNINASTILGGLKAVAVGLAASILNAVTVVILRRVDQIIGSALSPIRHIRMLIDDLTASLVGTKSLFDKATNLDNYLSNRQNCAVNGANILNCLAQSAINKITNKVAMSVDKSIGGIADSVTKEAVGVNGAIASHVNMGTKFLDKAKLQQKLLT